jgi:hypothetical protein
MMGVGGASVLLMMMSVTADSNCQVKIYCLDLGVHDSIVFQESPE